MKKFIKVLLLFFLFFLVITYVIDFYVSSNLKKSHEYLGEIEVWNDIYSGNIQADMLIYGSSRAWVDISPKILKDSLNLDAYNLGMDGHNFWLQYLRHLEFKKYNKKPKYIVAAVDFMSLQKRENLYLYEQFLPFMLWNPNMFTFTKSYTGFSFFDYYFPLIRYSGKKSVLKNVFLKSKKLDDEKYRTRGYKGIEKKWNSDLTGIKPYEVKLDTASISLFDKFLKDCKKDSIQVVLVYTPEYIAGQKVVKNRQDVISLYKKLAKSYNLPFLDYSSDSICLNKAYFYNALHLNKKGSEVFTKKLAKDLDKNIN